MNSMSGCPIAKENSEGEIGGEEEGSPNMHYALHCQERQQNVVYTAEDTREIEKTRAAGKPFLYFHVFSNSLSC